VAPAQISKLSSNVPARGFHLCGLVLAERRSGHVIMLLVGLFAAGMPVIHMRGAHYGEIAKSTGGFFFVWALGGLGGFTFILSARGLWSLRRRQPR
jgi:biotin transporter BioY